MCTYCETPTKFTTFNRLMNHVKRFHSAFDQKERGYKRKDEEEEEVFPKKIKWSLDGI